MRKAVRLLAAVTVVACFFVAEASTETLPLPANLISLNSEEGERLLL
jgi:hypothetical protein